MKTKTNPLLIRHLHIAMLVLILLGCFFSWEKNHEGRDFLDNYVKDQTKWMILDMFLFTILLYLAYASRGSPTQQIYLLAIVWMILMKVMHFKFARDIHTADKPSGGTKAHLDDLFYGTLFNGFIIGISLCYVLTH